MSKPREYYKNAWYTPTQEKFNKVEKEIDTLDTALKSLLPTVPTEDGTYVLTCTVASGEVSLTWESTEE